MAMIASGAAAGFAGIKLPVSEAGVVASIFILGTLAMVAVRVPLATAMPVVGGFAMLCGYAYATEAPEGDPGRYIVGLAGEAYVLAAH